MAVDPHIIQVALSQPVVNGLFDQLALIPGGGGGHFSVVFAARHISTQARVALKFLTMQAQSDPYRAACFRREGELLQKLRGEEEVIALVEAPQELALAVVHPGTGATFTLRCPFFATEWMANGSLCNYCTAVATASEFIERLFLFRQAYKSLTRLNRRHQLVHRDLKPGNFLVNDRALVKLADLGTTRLLLPGNPPLLAHYPGPVGDYWYTAPEMIAGLHSDEALLHCADLYSLGAILFEMLIGLRLALFTIGNIIEVRQFEAHFNAIPEAKRQATFDAFLDHERRPRIPDLCSVNPLLPRGARERITELVQSLAAFDYRKRVRDRNRVYQTLDTCIAIVKHEREYQQMLARRRQRRQGSAHA